MGDHGVLDNLDLFDQSRFGASEDKVRPLDEKPQERINYAGFGLSFDEDEDIKEEGNGQANKGTKGQKKAQKVKKQHEKLLFGTDEDPTEDKREVARSTK